jgi:hypothetical protein
MTYVIVKNKGFRLLNDNELELEAGSLTIFLKTLVQQPEVVEAYRSNDIKVDDESLTIEESETIIATLEKAVAKEIFSDVTTDDDY